MTWPADGRQLPTRPGARRIDRLVHESADHWAGRSVPTGSIRNFGEIARYQIHLFSIHSHCPRAIDERVCGWTEALCPAVDGHADRLDGAAEHECCGGRARAAPAAGFAGRACGMGCSIRQGVFLDTLLLGRP